MLELLYTRDKRLPRQLLRQYASVVDEVLSYAQAVLQCTLDGYVDNVLSSNDPFDKCVNKYMGK